MHQFGVFGRQINKKYSESKLYTYLKLLNIVIFESRKKNLFLRQRYSHEVVLVGDQFKMYAIFEAPVVL